MNRGDPDFNERIAILWKAFAASKSMGDDNVPSKIEEGLYLGSVGAANNKSELTSLNVTHILTVASSLNPAYPNDFVYKIIRISDREEVQISEYFDECFDFIEEAKRAGGVLVHCFVGKSRSVTIVISYLMRKRGMTFSEAFQFVKSRRPVAGPNAGFISQLQSYEKTIIEGAADPSLNMDDVQETSHGNVEPTTPSEWCPPEDLFDIRRLDDGFTLPNGYVVPPGFKPRQSDPLPVNLMKGNLLKADCSQFLELSPDACVERQAWYLHKYINATCGTQMKYYNEVKSQRWEIERQAHEIRGLAIEKESLEAEVEKLRPLADEVPVLKAEVDRLQTSSRARRADQLAALEVDLEAATTRANEAERVKAGLMQEVVLYRKQKEAAETKRDEAMARFEDAVERATLAESKMEALTIQLSESQENVAALTEWVAS